MSNRKAKIIPDKMGLTPTTQMKWCLHFSKHIAHTRIKKFRHVNYARVIMEAGSGPYVELPFAYRNRGNNHE